ncbi:hypothetical protein scyTo_0008945 [Scyliorhinus torazame]|uniref:Uncharacterized protein n=1 Tax=Scyliorhinus torazame TaxID=75743 RepID=A0A401PFB8_SCYTO|nr:hypothetical protein [Scyliorhinus torazame]
MLARRYRARARIPLVMVVEHTKKWELFELHQILQQLCLDTLSLNEDRAYLMFPEGVGLKQLSDKGEKDSYGESCGLAAGMKTAGKRLTEASD